MHRDPLPALEAIWDVDAGEQAWLAGIAAAASGLLALGHGVMAYTYDARAPEQGVRILEHALLDMAPAHFEARQEVLASLPPEAAWRMFYEQGGCATTSELFGIRGGSADLTALRRHAPSLGLHDYFAVAGLDGTGVGVVVASAFDGPACVLPWVRGAGQHFAAHLAAAHRLRRTRPRPEPEAVVGTDGRILAMAPGRDAPPVRRALMRAVRSRGRARGALLRNMAPASLAAWAPLVGGRWSLLDGANGEVRAIPNLPVLPEIPGLDERERLVAAFVALRHPDDLISYETGLGKATVAAARRRAMVVIGAQDRAGLSRRLLPFTTP